MDNNTDHLDHKMWIDHGQEIYEAFSQEYEEWMKWCEQTEGMEEQDNE
tara:strand:- start:87 stop:230 length:144 start_codon:yes stop_codon:yes gene_type:complete